MTGYAPYYDRFAAAMLSFIDAPQKVADALVAWIGGEAGWSGSNIAVKNNNPLNIKYNSFQSYGISVDGTHAIKNVDDGTQLYGTFRTPERGAIATARYLLVGAHGYPAIIQALKSGDSLEAVDAIARSDWAASHYGLPRANHLLANLKYVRQFQPPIQPEPIPVQFVQISSSDVAQLESIDIPADTPIEDFAGNEWTKIGPTKLHVLPGLVDAHTNRRMIVISTARYYGDKIARPTVQVAVFK